MKIFHSRFINARRHLKIQICGRGTDHGDIISQIEEKKGKKTKTCAKLWTILVMDLVLITQVCHTVILGRFSGVNYGGIHYNLVLHVHDR